MKLSAPGHIAVQETGERQLKHDPLLLAIIGTAIGLTILVLGIAGFWGSGPVLAEIPWYISLISAFNALTTLSVAFLALGRYQVLRDSISYWAGLGFAAYGIGQIFYALTWPGLLPGGESILGHLANTPAVIALLDLTILDVFLLAAVLMRSPAKQSLAGRRWLWSVAAWLFFATALFCVLILFEPYLPVFVSQDGRFTSLQQAWVTIQLFLFALGSIISTLYYQRTGDKLAGYIAFPQMALVFIHIMVLFGGKRYDLWWYMQRVILVSGYITVLFGLLSEYVRLLRSESEGRWMLEAILDNIPVGLAVTGGPPHFPLARVSRHGLEMNQRPVEGLIGLTSGQHQAAWRIFLPDGLTQPSSEHMPLYRASQFGEEVRNVELIMEAQDGRRIPVLVNAAPIRDGQGKTVAAINTWLDITDRKRAEEVLRESEALYRATARSIPSGAVFVVDKNLRYLIAEGTIIERFGLSRDRLEGHTVSEIFNADMAARMEARFRRAFAGETVSYETEHNGRIYWTQHALMDDALGHVIVVTLDITERKQAEEALRESEERLRAILSQATAGIVRKGVDGTLLFVNQAFCNMLDYTSSELVGKTIWQLTHHDDVEENKRLFDRLMVGGIPFQLEKRLICRDGSILWMNVSVSPIMDTAGRPRSAVAVEVDITARKQAEEALQKLNLQLESRVEKRTAELQSVNQALFESRRGLQILSQRLVEVQEEERRAIARELHDRVGQTLAALNINLMIMSDQLLEDSKQRIGSRMDDSMRLVADAIALVRDVMTDLRPAVLDDYGLEAALQSYIAQYQSRYEMRVLIDGSDQPIPRLGPSMEMTLLRIAQEALTNVARHAHSDQVKVSLQMVDEAVHLSIQDNGIGMEASQPITHPSSHGLKIMRERAEAIGGTLMIESEPGKGTKVKVIIPIGTGTGTQNRIHDQTH
jgi:PAS domain S-box-containing protein